MSNNLPKWKVSAVKVFYDFCLSKNLIFSLDEAAKEFSISRASVYNIQHTHNLKYVDRQYKQERYKINPETGCWEWQLSLINNKYGEDKHYQKLNGGSKLAHIIEYEKVYGKVPKHLELDHLCKNTKCVNPEHLEAVTPKINKRRNSYTKLAENDISLIKDLHFNKKKTLTFIATKYKVSITTIWNVINNKTWQ